MKIITIVGARPQFIKAAAVSRAIQENNQKRYAQKINEIIVHTGQHYDNNMSQVFFDELEFPKPDYNLGVGSGSHGKMTGAILEKTEQVLLKEQPDWVLVDARTIPDIAVPQTAIVGGDASDGTIAAASIVAKVHRDAIMRHLGTRYPGYGLDRHMGYGTEQHLEALRRLGPSPVHRRSFAPVAKAAAR